MTILLVLVLMMGTVFLLGSEYGQGKITKAQRREDINNKRYELKNSGLQSIPYNHAEKLEATFAKDVYGNREFKFAALIVTSQSGRRFVVDTDLRSNDGTCMELTSFVNESTPSVKTYLYDINVIDVISKSIEFETSTDIERYFAFQQTINDIYRGRHWLSKNDLSSVEIRFFDLTYGELRTIADQESYVLYFNTAKTLTKTEELFRRVDNTTSIAEASLARCDEMVSIGKEVIKDIIADTINIVRTIGKNQNDLMLAYADALASGEEFISDEELKDIKIFTQKDKTEKPKKDSNIITLKEVESIVNNAKLFNSKAFYEIAMDSDDLDVGFYKHNRKQKENKKSKKRNKKQRKHLDN